MGSPRPGANDPENWGHKVMATGWTLWRGRLCCSESVRLGTQLLELFTERQVHCVAPSSPGPSPHSREKGPLAGLGWAAMSSNHTANGPPSPGDQTEGNSLGDRRIQGHRAAPFSWKAPNSSARPKFSHPLLKCVLSPFPPRTVSCGSGWGKYRGQLLLWSCLAGAEHPFFLRWPAVHLPGARGPGCSVMWIPVRVPGSPAAAPTSTTDPSRPTVLQTGA